MAERENAVPVIKCLQWLNGKTLSSNAMSFLKFSAFIITPFFQYLSERLVKA
jgi:hypothetical protein